MIEKNEKTIDIFNFWALKNMLKKDLKLNNLIEKISQAKEWLKKKMKSLFDKINKKNQ